MPEPDRTVLAFTAERKSIWERILDFIKSVLGIDDNKDAEDNQQQGDRENNPQGNTQLGDTQNESTKTDATSGERNGESVTEKSWFERWILDPLRRLLAWAGIGPRTSDPVSPSQDPQNYGERLQQQIERERLYEERQKLE